MIFKNEDLRDCDLICRSQGKNCNFCNNMMLLIHFRMGSAVLLILRTDASPGSSYIVFMYTTGVLLAAEQHSHYFTTFLQSFKNILSSDSVLHNVYSAQYYLHLPNN